MNEREGRREGPDLKALRESLGRKTHDLNNALSAVLGYGRLLQAAIAADDPRRHDIAEVLEAAERACEITEAIRRLGDDVPSDRDVPFDVLVPPAPPQSSRGGRVLVVEDERSVRYLVRTILTRAGYEVAEAESPAAAEAALDSGSAEIDLLVTDLTMPGESGVVFAERVLARYPGARVLYMSGYSTEAAARPAEMSGTSFIQKPFTADDLLAIVGGLLLDGR